MQQHDSISSHNLISILVLLMIGSSVLGGVYSTGNDVWISILVSIAAAVPLFLMYSRIVTLYPGMGLFDIIDKLFGKVGGKVLIALMTWYAIHIGALFMRNFVEYTIAVTLDRTPRIALMVTMTIVSLYLSKSGHKIYGRWASIMCILVTVNFAITLLLSFQAVDFSNMLPVMSHSLPEIGKEALTFGSVAFGEAVLLLPLFGFYKKEGKPKKIYLKALLFGGIIVFLSITRNLLVLGPHLFVTSNFPSYASARLISFGGFIERFESIISINFIFLGVSKISMCMLSASSGIAKFFNISKSKNMVMPAGLLILALCSVLFGSMPEILNFADAYRYYALPFQIAIPFLIWITAEVKSRKERPQVECSKIEAGKE